MILGLRLPPPPPPPPSELLHQWTFVFTTPSQNFLLFMFLESKVRPIVFFPSFLLTTTDWSHHRPLPRGDVHVTDLTLLEVPTWLAATASSKYRKTRCYSRVPCPPSSCCVEIVTWFIRDSHGGLRRACVPPSTCFIDREIQIFLNCTYRHFKSLTFIFT